MRILENAITTGKPVLLENVGETVDSGFNSILERNIIKQKGSQLIKFGDGLIDYNNNFRFYITTCLKNPHYLPETAVMVTLINFMITEQGLREQLLAKVVVQERPDLQEKKESLIVESAKNRNALYNAETQILQVLSSSESNILEDENAINILTSSKALSEDIQSKQVIAVSTEAEIDEARQAYIPVAKHSAVLFFCITELSSIEPMYQYSLAWFLNLFVTSIIKSPKSEVFEERLQYLNAFFTKSIYENVCRSLFEKDKLVFSLALAIGIMTARNDIEASLLAFFLTGGVALDNPHANPASEWLSDKSWNEIVRADAAIVQLSGLHEHVAANSGIWKKFYDLQNPEDGKFPEPYDSVTDFVFMILLKALRPDKIVHAVRNFIIRHLGKEFVEPPSFDLQASFNDSSPIIPLVFILSPGSDPMDNLLMFAREHGMYEKCKSISLGQGQGPRAEKLIDESIRLGHWVVLQNCHVMESWMGELERICMDSQTLEATAHTNFRLWITSYPVKTFPVAVLQNSVKMTNEAPKGLRLNILRSLNSDPLYDDEFFSNAFSGEIGQMWCRGVFSLVFFHAVIQERRDFGPLGWNIPYEFNESDLKISLMQLKMFIEQYQKIPFEGHKYLTGECNYGGRVTDDKDRRLLMSLLDSFYNEHSVFDDNYLLSESGIYKMPFLPNKVNSIEYILALPLTPNPEVFGLHENADITKNVNETSNLIQGVLLTQTQLVSGALKTGDGQETEVDPVLELCHDIAKRLPNSFDEEAAAEKYPTEYTNSMNTVLRQELIRFNRLLAYIKISLNDTRRAILGQIAMIPELERIHKSMAIGKLPEAWAKKSFPSLRPLGSYINDFLARLTFYQRWLDEGEPSVYWLSGFYFTQCFLTGVLQNHSRKNNLPIDHLHMKFDVTDYEMETHEALDMGVFIRGIFLEGTRWNRQTHVLDESFPKILFDALPIITMTPMLKTEELLDEERKKYQCPIYKTTERRGVLATTGHSSNFVMFIQLNTDKSPNHWINRGAASILSLND